MGCATSKQVLHRDNFSRKRSHSKKTPPQRHDPDPPLSRSSSMPNPYQPNNNTGTQNRLPKTPTKTPPNEPEMIDTWELMEGLDVTPLYLPKTKADDRRSFSFDSSVQWTPAPPPPPWLHNVVKPDEDKFDPKVLSTFRKALEQLSPKHGFLLRRASPGPNKESGLVKSMVGVFEREKDRKRNPPSGCEVVLYYTSLRGVRRTYEECCEVRRILRGYGVRVDERDVSMDLGYKEEVSGRGLPAVVVRGEWVGGAEEVRGLHEMGEMEGVLKGVGEVVGGGGGSCEGCGDVRFVNCGRCYGSCKVFVGAEGGGGFERCTDCNENGIVRCPVCSC